MVDDFNVDLGSRLPDSVSEQIIKAVRSENPLGAVKDVLYECREKHYFEDVVYEARIMLLLERYSRSRKN